MADNVSNEFLKEKEDQATNLMTPEFMQKAQAYAGLNVGGQQTTPQSQPESPTPSRGLGGTILNEGVKQVAGGAFDAVNEVSDMVDAAWDWAGANLDFLKSFHDDNPDVPHLLPDIAEAETTAGGMIRGTAQFLTGFIPALKVTKLMKLGMMAAPVAGAVADFAVFDPTEERVSNLIQQFPALSNPITEYLMANENDSEAEGRFKNVLEGMGLGAVVEGLTIGLKAFRGIKKVTGEASPAAGIEVPEPAAFDISAPKTSKLKFNKPTPEGDALVDKMLAGGDDLADVMATEINYAYIDAPEDVISLMQNTEKALIERKKDRAGIQGIKDWGTVKKGAKMLGLDGLNGAKKLFGDVENLDEKLLNFGNHMVASAKTVDDLVLKVANEGMTDDKNLLLLRRAASVHAGIMDYYKGTQREIARAMNSMKIPRDGKISQAQLDLIFESVGGRKNIRDFAEKYKNLGDLTERANLVKQAERHNWKDAAVYYWINSILSGPTTQMVNITSNMITLGADLAEHTIAGLKPGSDVTMSQVWDRFTGTMLGFGDAFKAAGRVLKEGADASRFPKQKLEAVSHRITTQSMGYDDHPFAGAADLMLNVIGLPGRALMGADEFFGSLAYRGELYTQLSKKMRADGLGRADIDKAVRDWMNDIPAHERSAEHMASQYKRDLLTFQQDLGKIGSKVQELSNASPLMKFVIPFVRTPVNIMKYVGRRTPVLARFSSEVRADLKAGGSKAALAKARINMGTAFYGTGIMLAANGRLSGGADPENMDVKRLIDRQNYSVKIGDKWVSFSRLDPFGAFMGLSADIVELAPHVSQGEIDEVLAIGITAFSRNVLNKTYLKGVVDILNALQEPQRRGEKWVQSFVTSWIPNVFGQINKAVFDQDIKEVNSVVEAMMAKIPLVSQGVPARRHSITGEEITYGEGGMGGLTPFYIREESKDPVLQEMYRVGYAPQDMPKSFKQGDVPLNPQQYDELQSLATGLRNNRGQNLHENLAAIINSPRYQAADDGDTYTGKQGMLRKAVTSYRSQAKRQFLSKNQEVMSMIEAVGRKK